MRFSLFPQSLNAAVSQSDKRLDLIPISMLSAPMVFIQSGALLNFPWKLYKHPKLSTATATWPVATKSHPKRAGPLLKGKSPSGFNNPKALLFILVFFDISFHIPFINTCISFAFKHIQKQRAFPHRGHDFLDVIFCLQLSSLLSQFLPLCPVRTTARASLWEQSQALAFFCLVLQRHLFLL